jgi:tetratricopeptide (TPR) repeat protein
MKTQCFKAIRWPMIVISGILLLGTTGCSSWFGQPDPQGQFARLGPVPDNRDVPAELLFPKDLEIQQDHERRGDILLQRGDFAGAFVQYEKYLAAHPNDLEVQHKKGLTFLMGQQYDEAAKVFEAVLAVDPEYTPSHQAMGRVCFETGDLDKAERHLRTVVAQDPSRWGAYNLLGNIYDRRHEYGQAIAAYQTAIRIAPSQGKIHQNLGVSYLLAKQYPEAAGALEKAVQLGIRDRRVFNNLGLAYAGMGQPQKALRAFKHGGNAPQAYNNLGCIYMQQGQYGEAIEAFEKAIAMSPQFYSKASSNLRNARAMLAKRAD